MGSIVKKLFGILLAAALCLGAPHAFAQASNIYYAKTFGVVANGTTDDTAALNKAIAAAANATLVISGTPLISSTITVSHNMKLIFEGGGSGFPSSYLVKKASMTTAGLILDHDGIVGYGVSVIGQVGNKGDCIVIHRDGITLYNPVAKSCGRDGIRVGDDTALSNHYNAFALYNPVTWFNGRYGLYIHDGTAASNTNAGTVVKLSTYMNGSDGLRLGNGYWNTFIGTHSEKNGGWGIYFAAPAQNNTYVGGDIEGNTSGFWHDLGTGNFWSVIGQTTTPALTANDVIYAKGTITSYRGSSAVPTATNSGFYFPNGNVNMNYAGTYYSGSVSTDSFWGRVPNSLAGINDAFGYVTINRGVPALRALFSAGGLALPTLGGGGGAISVQGVDTCGAGYRCLRVPN